MVTNPNSVGKLVEGSFSWSTTQSPCEVEGIRTYIDFEVIEIFNDINPYPTLLGINRAIENQTILNFKKRILSFKDSYMRVVAPLDLLERQRYVKPV